MHRTSYVSFLFLIVFALSAAAEISITASFNPPRVAQGDSSRYVVEIRETSTQAQPQPETVSNLQIPPVEGLTLRNGRSSVSSQTRIVNSAAEYSGSQQLIFEARPTNEGRYTVPSYGIAYKGQNLRVPEATLEVVERSADAGPTADELIFLTMNAPETLYVGQTTELQLKLFISDQVRLGGLNRFDRSTDGFLISELSDSRESNEIFQGRRYRVLSWPLTITPIRTGPQDLNFQFTITASLPGRNNQTDPFGRRGFGNSLFDDFFGRSEQFNVFTEATTVDVLPLPPEGRPRIFSGAIGEFGIQVYTDHQATEVGEPIMLSLEVSGRGNFDRINGPEIPENDDWRIYSPEASFQPLNQTDTSRGTKRFDYIIIPRQSGLTKTPEVKFAYFDPSSKDYVILEAPPTEISVRPSSRSFGAQQPTSTAPQSAATTQEAIPQQMSVEESLLILDYQATSHSPLLDHPLQTPVFWILNGFLSILAILAALIMRHRQRLKEDPGYRARLQTHRELREAISQARKASSPAIFYEEAPKTIRLLLTDRTQKNHRTASPNEVAEALEKLGVDHATAVAARQLLRAADLHRFAPEATSKDLTADRAQLETILKAL